MSYVLFFVPAALVVAVLTLMVVPFLSLVVLVIGPLAIAAAGLAVAVKVVAARSSWPVRTDMGGHEPPPLS
jgi:hypothetical protein